VTCSPHPAETTAIVDWAEKTYGNELQLIDATELLQKLNPELRTNAHIALSAGRKTVQLWPQRQETDAMFIALLTKTA
jgi:16S rRNA (cytosine967-C5)-methyltransferase